MSNDDSCRKLDNLCGSTISEHNNLDGKCEFSLNESIIQDNGFVIDKSKPCEARAEYVSRRLNHNRFMRRFSRWLPSNIIHSICYRMRDGILWNYNCYWEIENEKRYNSKDFYEEEPFIIEQRFLPANRILMGDYAIDESYFPWHGHSFDDFIQLNSELQACIGIVQNIRGSKDVKHFRLKHRTVYDAFFEDPICLSINDKNEYCFGSDGRHRVYAASVSNGLLPVWIIEYKDPKTVSIDYFKKHALSGTWRFLEKE